MGRTELRFFAAPTLILLVLLSGCRFTPRVTDLTNAEGLAPLVGVCLSTDTDMALSPIGDEEGYFLSSWEAIRLSDGNITKLGPGSRTQVQEIELRETFDSTYLTFWGTVKSDLGVEYSRVNLNELIDYTWRTVANMEAASAQQIDIDTQYLPFRLHLVSFCPDDDQRSPIQVHVYPCSIGMPCTEIDGIVCGSQARLDDQLADSFESLGAVFPVVIYLDDQQSFGSFGKTLESVRAAGFVNVRQFFYAPHTGSMVEFEITGSQSSLPVDLMNRD